MRTLKWIGLTLAALCATGVQATTLPKSGEASLLVTGSIEVAADGSVLRHAIDHADKLDAGVAGVIDASMADWHFKPMHAASSATMRLVLHARRNEAGKYVLWIASASFETPHDAAPWGYSERHEPPAYPREALEAGVVGTTYLAVHVDRGGNVVDALVEQVNLGVEDAPTRMAHWRDVLGKASLAAARTWRFERARGATIADVDAESARTIRVPVEYRMDGTPAAKYGRWDMYIPGPRQPIPWLAGAEGLDKATQPDALAANSLHSVTPGMLQLETPLAAD